MPALLLALLLAAAALAAESGISTVSVVLLGKDGQDLPAQTMEKVTKPDAEWRAPPNGVRSWATGKSTR